MIIFWRSRLTRLFFMLQVISLSGMYFTKDYYVLSSLEDYMNLLLIAVLTLLVILPWRNIEKYSEIHVNNINNLSVLTTILLWISLYVIIINILTIISLYSSISLFDINEYKYGGTGLSEYFTYNVSMVNVKLKILANYLYNFTLLLIPLHFFYLSRGEKKLSVLCLLGSLAIIFHGLSYFSRVTSVHWMLLYSSMLIYSSDAISSKYVNMIKKVAIIIGSLTAFQFMVIGSYRFLDYKGIKANSIIQDAQTYSTIHYLSQSFKYGMTTLKDYNYETFHGQLSMMSVYDLLNYFGLIDWDYDTFFQLRRQLWPNHYYTFNGLVSYSIYDYGYVLSFILFIGYYLTVRSLKSKNQYINLTDMLIMFLLIQIPLFAIFYSSVRGLVLLSIILIPVNLFIKSKRTFRLKSA